MTKGWYDEHEWEDPQRDDRGRFRKGSTGNPRGRPRKQPPSPWSLEESFARALAEEVPVSGPGGTQKMPLRDVLITSALREAVNAKGRDKFYAFERLVKMNLLKAPPEEEQDEEEIYTEEDCRIIAAMSRALPPSICSGCSKPVTDGSERELPGDDFRFD